VRRDPRAGQHRADGRLLPRPGGSGGRRPDRPAAQPGQAGLPRPHDPGGGALALLFAPPVAFGYTVAPPTATEGREPMSATVTHWRDAKCARAFWSQGELPAYQRLLADTIAGTRPVPGQHWLDLGCGAGRLTRALWQEAQGQLGSVVAVDLAEANAKVIDA